MTCVVYSNDTIGTDSLKIYNITDQPVVVFEPKLFISKDKTFCFGFCGNEWYGDFDKETFVLELLKEPAKKKTIPELSNVTFFILAMTKTKTYVISNEPTPFDKEGEESVSVCSITRIGGDVPFGLGTGGAAARNELVMGSSVEEAIQTAILHDSYSGGNIYLCSRSSLKSNKLGY